MKRQYTYAAHVVNNRDDVSHRHPHALRAIAAVLLKQQPAFGLRTDRRAAALTHTSRQAVVAARAVLQCGDPVLIESVFAGMTPLMPAARQVRSRARRAA